MRILCPVSLQRPQRLSTRTLFNALSPSPRLLPALLASKPYILLTVRVSSVRTYRRLRLLRFVVASNASWRLSIFSRSSTISCAICRAPLLNCVTISSKELADNPGRFLTLCWIRVLYASTLRAVRGVFASQAPSWRGDNFGVCTTTSSFDSTASRLNGTSLAPLKPACIFSFVNNCLKVVLKASKKVSLLI